MSENSNSLTLPEADTVIRSAKLTSIHRRDDGFYEVTFPIKVVIAAEQAVTSEAASGEGLVAYAQIDPTKIVIFAVIEREA